MTGDIWHEPMGHGGGHKGGKRQPVSGRGCQDVDRHSGVFQPPVTHVILGCGGMNTSKHDIRRKSGF